MLTCRHTKRRSVEQLVYISVPRRSAGHLRPVLWQQQSVRLVLRHGRQPVRQEGLRSGHGTRLLLLALWRHWVATWSGQWLQVGPSPRRLCSLEFLAHLSQALFQITLLQCAHAVQEGAEAGSARRTRSLCDAGGDLPRLC